MSQDKITKAIVDLSPKIEILSETLDKSSKSSNKNQKALIFWTIIMTLAILSQAILIGIQLFGK
jgi:hypothetical protein